MKKVAIMQPYFFPYMPYFQLISEVDEFLFLDDVQYIRRGWVNRNRILLGSEAFIFSLPVEKGRRNDLIHEKRFAENVGRDIARTTLTLQHAYADAPFGEIALQLFSTATESAAAGAPLTSVLARSIEAACEFMGLAFKARFTSDMEIGSDIRGQERILAICRVLSAKTYVNPIGGEDLYDAARFAQESIDLAFLHSDPATAYPQVGGGAFVGNLSILDVIAHLGGAGAAALLERYRLKPAA